MVPFPAVNLTAIPWDFVLILVVLGVIVPWRGVVRVRRLLSRPDFGTSDRLSLYGTTIAFQWFLVFAVAWRAFSRNVRLEELGLTTSDGWRTTWMTATLTVLLCTGQFASLRRILRMPYGERGSLFHITEKIMPRTWTETLVFTALACTAGLSEEFLYRGFLFAVFARMFSKAALSIPISAVLSSIWFAVGHLYQGRRGIITTFVVSMIFAMGRIGTGSLVPPVAAHIGVDLIAGLYMANFARKANNDA